METIDNKEVIKVVISSGTEKPYYLRKKGRTPEGCYIRVGSSKERMTERMIDDMYSKRIKNTLKEIDSPRQELTFNQLKIYYEEHGLKLNDNFLQNLDLLTSEGKYNYNAFLLADENNVYAKIEYKGRKEVEMIDKAALKEAVINAMVHNDYSYGNSPIVELLLKSIVRKRQITNDNTR